MPTLDGRWGHPSDKQVKTLEKLGIFPEAVESAGKAAGQVRHEANGRAYYS